MIKAWVGRVPNLHWYQIQNMTDEEIAKFNRSHLVEVDLSDKPNMRRELEKMAFNKMDDASKKFWSSPDNIKQNVFAKEVWNAAIEAAAVKSNEEYTERAIRKLKL